MRCGGRSFGPAVISDNWDHHWIWWLGPLTGSLIASLIWGGAMMLASPVGGAASNVAKSSAPSVQLDMMAPSSV